MATKATHTLVASGVPACGTLLPITLAAVPLMVTAISYFRIVQALPILTHPATTTPMRRIVLAPVSPRIVFGTSFNIVSHI